MTPGQKLQRLLDMYLLGHMTPEQYCEQVVAHVLAGPELTREHSHNPYVPCNRHCPAWR